MRITAVEPVVLSVPLAEPVRTSFGAMKHRSVILVRVETDAGLTGWGESWSNFPAWSARERVCTIREGLAPLILGQDPRQVGWLHDRMDPTALSAPLPHAGVTACKLRVGFGAEAARRNLAALRDLLGPDRLLLADANQAWDLRGAKEMLSLLAPFAPFWLEERLPADQVAELAELRRMAPRRIVAGENVYGLWRMELDANPNPLRTELAGDLLVVREGCLTVPEKPGLGLEPAPALLARYAVDVG